MAKIKFERIPVDRCGRTIGPIKISVRKDGSIRLAARHDRVAVTLDSNGMKYIELDPIVANRLAQKLAATRQTHGVVKP